MMRRQALLNLFMLLLVGALTALVLWGPEPEAPVATPLLTELQADRVQRIEITFAERSPVVLLRDGGRWFIDNGQRWPADADRIQRILALTDAVSHARYPVAELDTAEVGLAPPRITLHLDDAVFEFGGQEPLNRYRYLRHGDAVHLVTDTVIHQLSDRPEDLVSRRLLPDDAKVVGLTLPGLSLQQGEGGAWRSIPPEPGRSQDSFNSFIEGWRYARALQVTPDSGDPGASADEVIVELGEPAQTVRFALISNDEDLVLERRDLGLSYSLAAGARERLLKLPAGGEPSQ